MTCGPRSRPAFLVGGRLAIAASREGGVLVRVDPISSDALVARTGARHAVMKGRSMDGWLRVDIDNLRTKPQLAKWVSRAAGYARSVGPKERKPKRR